MDVWQWIWIVGGISTTVQNDSLQYGLWCQMLLGQKKNNHYVYIYFRPVKSHVGGKNAFLILFINSLRELQEKTLKAKPKMKKIKIDLRTALYNING